MSGGSLRIDGGRPLRGKVKISGAKNAALPCMFAALLSDQPCALLNVPRLGDIDTAGRILGKAGRKTERRSTRLLLKGKAHSGTLDPADARAMRASILALGPLLARGLNATVPLPGGCDIGSRPIAVHLAGLEQLGASIRVNGGFVHGKAPRRLSGAHIAMEFPSFTGTENLLMAAAIARGKTVIENAACEPEVANLASMLNQMGARIAGAGTSTIEVDGVAQLGGCEHAIMPDRIEAGTYLAAAAATGGRIVLEGADPSSLGAVLAKLEAMGLAIAAKDGHIKASAAGRPEAAGFETAVHPGFPTDLQAQLMAVNCIAHGKALIVEHIFERRFRHADELMLLGANIQVRGNQALVTGVRSLTGAEVTATDLRASASLAIAALSAKGTSIIRGLEHLERGYDDMPGKLRKLGASVRRLRAG